MKKSVLLFVAVALLIPLSVMAQDPNDGWVKIFNGKDLEGWKPNSNPENFYVNEAGEIAGKGGRCHLFYMEELQEFELLMDVYINDGGNSGVYILSPWVDEEWPTGGFELQVNSTQSDPVKTGSLYDLIKIFESPSPADAWFTYHVIVKGNTLTVKVNDKVLYTYVDPTARFARTPNPQRNNANAQNQAPPQRNFKYIGQKGHIALQQHDPGSLPKFKNIYIKKL
jgi:hypothetical protein